MRGLWWSVSILLLMSLLTTAAAEVPDVAPAPEPEGNVTMEGPAIAVEMPDRSEAPDAEEAPRTAEDLAAAVIAEVERLEEEPIVLPASVPTPPRPGGDEDEPEEARPRERTPADEGEDAEAGDRKRATSLIPEVLPDEILPLLPLPLRPVVPTLDPLALVEPVEPPREEPAPPVQAVAPVPQTTAVAAAEPPALPPAVLAVAAVVAASGGVLAAKGSAPALRLLGLLRRTIWLPLYARVAKARVLDHEVRQDIVNHLRANPGACVTDLQEVVGLSINAVTHHLRVLESNGLVSSVKSGRRRCFFASGDGLSAGSRRAVAALSSDSVRRVYDAIRRRPGIRQQDLAAALGVSATSVVFHARRLEDAGVVERAKSGRALAYYPAGVRAE